MLRPMPGCGHACARRTQGRPGQRQAQREAIQTKRETFAISDVVASDDIGKLPDHNTAAASTSSTAARFPPASPSVHGYTGAGQHCLQESADDGRTYRVGLSGHS